MTDHLDDYFERQEAKARALTVLCPVCHSAPGESCTDRYTQLTSLIHRARHDRTGVSYHDPYAME